jgi:hypothetical protein
VAQLTVVFVLCFSAGSLSSKDTVLVRKQGRANFLNIQT